MSRARKDRTTQKPAKTAPRKKPPAPPAKDALGACEKIASPTAAIRVPPPSPRPVRTDDEDYRPEPASFTLSGRGIGGVEGRTKRQTAGSSQAPGPGRSAFPIVGIGASAGGLEALEIFLKNVPADSGLVLANKELAFQNEEKEKRP